MLKILSKYGSLSSGKLAGIQGVHKSAVSSRLKKRTCHIGLLALTIVLFITVPNLGKQAEDAGSLQFPDTADSQKAAVILAEAGASEEKISLVYPLEEQLVSKDKKLSWFQLQSMDPLMKSSTRVIT